MTYPIIEPGKRVTASGRTGSGKTTWACWLLKRSPLHWVILNPKHTAGYKTLPDCEIINRFDLRRIEKAIYEKRFILVNPTAAESNPVTMDLFIEWLHTNFENVGLCCDELYTLHTGLEAGPGLIGWLTRGRELRQSFIGLSQRPARISLFCFSEADYLVEMDLQLKRDRQRFYEFTGDRESLARLRPRQWLFYDANADDLKLYGAVPA